MAPKKNGRVPCATGAAIPSDIVGVIAEFLPPNTKHQQPLLLVNHTWHRGVISQDGMKRKPNVKWSFHSLQERQPKKLNITEDAEDEDVERLVAAFPHLQEFSARGCYLLDEAAFHHLGKLEELTALDLCACFNFSTAALESVSTNLKHLSSLDLSNIAFRFKDETYEILSNIQSLTTLDISADGGSLSDVGAEHVSKLKNLTTLNLNSCYGTSAVGLHHLCTGLTNLTSLDVTHCKVDDAVVEKSICTMTKLKELVFHEARAITNSCMPHLAKMKSLTSLTLEQTGVGDEGMASVVEMKQLTELVVRSSTTSTTPAWFTLVF